MFKCLTTCPMTIMMFLLFTGLTDENQCCMYERMDIWTICYGLVMEFLFSKNFIVISCTENT